MTSPSILSGHTDEDRADALGSAVSSHTPGPWRMDGYGMYIWADHPEKGPWAVGDIRGWGFLTGKGHGALGLSEDEAISIQKANGSLIAAAPDLLNGCNALLGLIQLVSSRADVSPLLREALTTGHRIDEARAAISKATGASQ